MNIAKNITGSDMLLLSLEAEGVTTIFGYPGGAIMPVYDELLNHADRLTHILTRHEQGAVHAAQGYSRAGGGVGVCFATSGPGATNLITGIADAMIDSTPLVCIAAQVNAPMLGSDAFQEADLINMTTPVTKWNYQITDQHEIASTIAKAFYIASTGRPGPVVIEITRNAQVGRGDFSYSPCTSIRGYKPTPQFSPETIDQAVELIANAQRPLLIVGNGVKIANAENELIAFAESGNIPVTSTLMGLSAMPTDHPLYVGMLGMHGNLAGNAMTQESDLIIAVGMRFSDRITGRVDHYAPKAKIIHIDIDPVEINKILRPAVAICADAKEVLPLLAARTNAPNRTEWMAFAAKQYQKEWDEVIKSDLTPNREELTMAEVVTEVAKQTNGNAIIVTDVGQQQMIAARYSAYKKTRSLITSGGLGTMGFGLPAAIGAKIAAPEREVIAFLGDGGFQMTLQELGTIMQWKIPVKIIVLNNSFLGMVRQWQELFWEKRYAMTPMENPDFVTLASAYGIPALRVSERNHLAEAITQMHQTKGAFFLEVCVGKEDNVFPMVPAGASISDLIFNK